MTTRQQQRQAIIRQRRQLPQKFQVDAAAAVAKKIFTLPFFLRSKHIAFYLPVNGELNPLPILERAWEMQKICYLPILHPLKHNRLYFIAYYPNDTLVANYYDILEPEFNTNKIIPAWALDLVFVPLVGFDQNNNRLGMGGGFYDRTFAFCHDGDKNTPFLAGLGYELQHLPQIKTEAWDIALDAVITEKNIII